MSSKAGIVNKVLKQNGRKRKLGPIIVDFEHGVIDNEAFEDFKVGVSHTFTKDETCEPELNVLLKSDNMIYSNLAESARNIPKNQLSKTWLVVRNKVTNEVRLVETNVVTVGSDVSYPKTINPFLLQEGAKKDNMKNEKTVEEKRIEKDSLWKHLVKEFGRKKGRRIVEQAERQKVDSSAKNEKLKSVVDDIDVSTIVLPTKEVPKELTPPCNREAKSIDAVYKLQDIVADEEMFLLEQAGSDLLQFYDTEEKVDEATKNKELSEVLGLVLKRQISLGKDVSMIGFGIYVDAIFSFLNLKPAQVSKGPKALPDAFPFSISRSVFDKFVPNGIASQENNDRAFCYGLITLLLISDYSIDMKLLSSAVKWNVHRIRKLVLVIGASIITDTLTKRSFVQLKLPLSKFDVSKPIGRPKRK